MQMQMRMEAASTKRGEPVRLKLMILELSPNQYEIQVGRKGWRTCCGGLG